jgi:hypothetical protein
MAPTPPPKATPRPTAAPPGNVVPFDSTLFFVLDDPISSKSSKAGEMARVHLKSALVVGNRTLAPAGTPARVRILDVSPSDIADTYGFVDIFFEPMQLPDGRMLPLRAPVARLAPHRSSGHESTVGTEDTVGDIFVPYYSFYQIFRHGKNFVLRAGSELPARTEATITADRDIPSHSRRHAGRRRADTAPQKDARANADSRGDTHADGLPLRVALSGAMLFRFPRE